MKEQSSTSPQKIQLPNKDLVGLKRSEEQKGVTKEKTKLPKPTGWRMLVLPFRMDEKTKGGILLGGETIDRQQVASQCGSVLAMGDACYKDKERYPHKSGSGRSAPAALLAQGTTSNRCKSPPHNAA